MTWWCVTLAIFGCLEVTNRIQYILQIKRKEIMVLTEGGWAEWDRGSVFVLLFCLVICTSPPIYLLQISSNFTWGNWNGSVWAKTMPALLWSRNGSNSKDPLKISQSWLTSVEPRLAQHAQIWDGIWGEGVPLVWVVMDVDCSPLGKISVSCSFHHFFIHLKKNCYPLIK